MLGMADSKLAVQLKCAEVVVSQLMMGLYGSQSEMRLFWYAPWPASTDRRVGGWMGGCVDVWMYG